MYYSWADFLFWILSILNATIHDKPLEGADIVFLDKGLHYDNMTKKKG
jgi:hypothetical protein